MAENTPKTPRTKTATKVKTAAAKQETTETTIEKPATTKRAAKKVSPAADQPAAEKKTAVARKPAAAKTAAPAEVSGKTEPAATGKETEKVSNVSEEERFRMIAEAAYFRAESRQFQGDPLHDWLEAEREIAELLRKIIR